MMNVAHLSQWLSDREIKAICWTLIHSLWQGLLIAALAGLVIATTRKASAKLRYHLFGVLLIAFTLAIALTFIYEIVWGTAAATVDGEVTITPGHTVIRQAVLANGKLSFLNSISNFLNSKATGIFAIWLICFLYKSVRLLGG
ncbi:MAG: hypothetical protein V4619_02860, partial [Bacteroidota bacterium]